MSALRPSRRRARRRGFTLVEVLLAMGVMTIGALAMMAFQQQVARSNRYARDLATATQVAENWIERLKADTRYWNLMDGRDQTTWPELPMLARTRWLQQIVGASRTYQTIKIDPVATPGIWNAADMNGFDVNPAAGPHRFCVSFRFAWVFFGSALRADVRVWWPKDTGLRNANVLVPFRTCDDRNTRLNPGGDMIDNYHVVYLSTVLRRSEQEPPQP